MGEALVRLEPPGRRPLEQTAALDVSIGGAELNTLIALSQLGYETRLLTRLPANPLGRLIVRHARSYAVDVAAEWDPAGRAGLYFVERGAAPRATSVLYDRATSSAAGLHSGLFDWAKVASGASAVHVTGITCALGAGPHGAVRALLQAARAQSVLTSFDLNHRSRLWSDGDASAAFRDLLPLADIVFASPHDLSLLLGRPGPAAELAQALADSYGAMTVVVRETSCPGPDQVEVTVRVLGAETAESTTVGARVVDPFGAGDVAAGIFLGCWLAGKGPAAAADFAARAYAHMNTIPGDAWAGTLLELDPSYTRGRTILR